MDKINCIFKCISASFLNGISILITCMTFLAGVMKFIASKSVKTDKQRTQLGMSFETTIMGPYLCLILAPFINLLIYFLCIIVTGMLHKFVVKNMSTNGFIVLIFLSLFFIVSEVSLYTVFNISFSGSINRLLGKIIFVIWNFIIASMISVFCSYLFPMPNEDDIMHAFRLSTPLILWCLIVVFLIIYYSNIINNNKCIEWSVGTGLLWITLYMVSYLYSGISGYRDFILFFILWLVSTVMYVAECTWCYIKAEGTVYLSNGESESVYINTCWADEENISYLGTNSIVKQRREISIKDFVRIEWNSRAYNSRNEVRQATFADGTKIEYTKLKKLKGGFVRLENWRKDKTVTIIVTKIECITDDVQICDERIIIPMLKKIGEIILAKNYQ